MKKTDDVNWKVAFKTAVPWVVGAAAVTIPCAFVLEDPWSNNPIDLLLVVAVSAVPLLLPVVSGRYHRSVKVGVAVAIMGIAIGFVVLVMTVLLSFSGGLGGANF